MKAVVALRFSWVLMIPVLMGCVSPKTDYQNGKDSPQNEVVGTSYGCDETSGSCDETFGSENPGGEVEPASDADAEEAIRVAREMFMAVADGDVETLRSLTTPEFYDERFPYDDETVREMLLEVPYDKREEMKYQIQYEADATATRQGDTIIVELYNEITGKLFTFRLNRDYGSMRVYDYTY